MPVLLNQADVQAETVTPGVTVKRLLTPERTGNDMISLGLWRVQPGATAQFTTGPADVASIQLLDGRGVFTHGADEDEAGPEHLFFLPPGFSGSLRAGTEMTALVTRAPSVDRFDKSWNPADLYYQRIDWKAEPVLDSGHDTRKRIYLVTPKLCNTHAMKAEMIIYPPGAVASNHHHVGAEHFQYVLSGSATVFLSEEPRQIRAGDTLYNYQYERHYMANKTDSEFIFVEYFVPGTYTTEWVDEAKVCTWSPTGRNLRGGEATRNIAAHSSAEAAGRSDI